MGARVTPTPWVTPDGWVSLGVVARAHGIKGALKLHLWHDDSTAIVPALRVRLGSTSEQRVVSYAAGILQLEGIHDRNQAEALAGAELFVRREDFPALGGEPYLIDLLDAPVHAVDGALLGHARGFSDNGAQPLLIVEDLQGHEVMVPYVLPLVVSGSREKIVLAPPPGLFELNREGASADDEPS